jgi:uncharacterized protein YfaP (DUF2135 family)
VFFIGLLSGCEAEPTGFSGQVSIDRFFSGVYAVMPSANTPPAAAKGSFQAAVAAVAAVNVEGVLRQGSYPLAANGVGATLELQSSIITGIPAKLRITGDAPFSRIALAVPGSNNYWEIVLPAAVSQVQLVATGASSIPNSAFTIETAVGTGAGFGMAGQQAVNAVDLANVDLAVVLRWNTLSDVDLHVTDAKNQEVYFGRILTAEGGRLDLDSNPACDFDGVNQEVITWPRGQAPVGGYKINVYYWSDCGQSKTDFSVTLMSRGRTVQVIDGTFLGEGSPSTNQEVARFSFP